MGTEDWVLKGTKLITNTKKQRLKILSKVWIFKNTILKKKKQKTNNKQTKKKHTATEIIKYIYMKFALKRASFLQGNSRL